MKKEKKVFYYPVRRFLISNPGKTIFLISLAMLICVSGLFFAREVRALTFEGQTDVPLTIVNFSEDQGGTAGAIGNRVILRGVRGVEDYDVANIGYVKSAIFGEAIGIWKCSNVVEGVCQDSSDIYLLDPNNTWDVGIGTDNPQAKFEVYDTGGSLAKIKTDGYIEVDGGIIPMTTGVGNIGTDTNRWGDIRMSGTLYDGGTTYYIDPNDTGTSAVFAGSITIGGDLTVSGASTNFRNAIKAVDGSGSLIDADLLDGYDWSTVPDGTDKWVDEVGDTMSGPLTMSGTSANIILGSNYLSGDGGDEGVFVDSTGKVGIGTAEPDNEYTLTVAGTVGTKTLAIKALGDIDIGTYKLSAGEMDPRYEIDEIVYATYAHSTTGLKEETIGKVELSQIRNPKSEILNKSKYSKSQIQNDYYQHTIDFDEAEVGSDLWLLREITAFGDDWNDLVVSLTPEGKANVWYEFIQEENKIIIYGDRLVKVSYRLVAPRFDWPERDTNLCNGTGKAPEGSAIFVR